MGICHFLLPLPASHIGMHHLSDDWAGADDGNLNNKIVELLRIIAWQRRHLRAALDLEHPHSIGLLKNAINLVLLRQLREIDFVAIVRRYQLQTVMDDGHHAKAEQVYLDDAKVGAVL